jgi:pimeloyl-ACP methyl ester carboxylesterase
MPKETNFVEVEAGERDRHYYHRMVECEGSFAMLSLHEDVTDAIIFVHGFGGDSYGTWAQFQLLIDQWEAVKAEFAKRDLYFFQYHSVWERVESSSNRLLKFMRLLIPEINLEHFAMDVGPVTVPKEESSGEVSEFVVPFPKDRKYERVTLAGHSEGGVVIRTMIVRDLENTALLNCRLALFAPAIAGYKPAGLLGSMANFPGLGLLLEAVLVAAPAYQDLKDKEDLKQLKTDTETAQSKGRALCADILWGHKDYVVKPQKYACDTQDFEDCNHTQICKPSEDYPKPLDHVKKWPDEKKEEHK